MEDIANRKNETKSKKQNKKRMKSKISERQRV